MSRSQNPHEYDAETQIIVKLHCLNSFETQSVFYLNPTQNLKLTSKRVYEE